MTVGDVLDDVDGERAPSLAVEHRGRLDERPALLARGPVDGPHDQRARLLARQHAAAGQVVDAQRLTVLGEGRVAVDDLPGRRGQQLLGGVEPEQ